MSTDDVSFVTFYLLKGLIVKSFLTLLWLSNLAHGTVVIILLAVTGVLFSFLSFTCHVNC